MVKYVKVPFRNKVSNVINVNDKSNVYDKKLSDEFYVYLCFIYRVSTRQMYIMHNVYKSINKLH